MRERYLADASQEAEPRPWPGRLLRVCVSGRLNGIPGETLSIFGVSTHQHIWASSIQKRRGSLHSSRLRGT